MVNRLSNLTNEYIFFIDILTYTAWFTLFYITCFKSSFSLPLYNNVSLLTISINNTCSNIFRKIKTLFHFLQTENERFILKFYKFVRKLYHCLLWVENKILPGLLWISSSNLQESREIFKGLEEVFRRNSTSNSYSNQNFWKDKSNNFLFYLPSQLPWHNIYCSLAEQCSL